MKEGGFPPSQTQKWIVRRILAKQKISLVKTTHFAHSAKKSQKQSCEGIEPCLVDVASIEKWSRAPRSERGNSLGTTVFGLDVPVFAPTGAPRPVSLTMLWKGLAPQTFMGSLEGSSDTSYLTLPRHLRLPQGRSCRYKCHLSLVTTRWWDKSIGVGWWAN